MDEFTLTIRLGNDAMQTGGDIAEALRKVADRIDARRFLQEGDGPVYDVTYGVLRDTRYDHNRIMDANGNAVGEWSIR